MRALPLIFEFYKILNSPAKGFDVFLVVYCSRKVPFVFTHKKRQEFKTLLLRLQPSLNVLHVRVETGYVDS